MGLFQKVGRITVNEAKNVLGWELAKRGYGTLRKQWARTNRKDCPACDKGVLYPPQEPIEGALTKYLGCNCCAHIQAVDVDSHAESIDILKKIAVEKIRALSKDEVHSVAQRQKILSRTNYVIAFGAFVLAAYMLLNSSALAAVNTTLLSMLFFVRGLVASYRNWQLINGVLYQPGSFVRWLKMGIWLV